MELEGEVWPPLEENQGAWDVMARAPMAVTFTSLPQSRRDSVQTFLQCRDRRPRPRSGQMCGQRWGAGGILL